MLRVLWVVAAEERPGALAMLAMDVLDPGSPGLFSEHGDTGLERLSGKGGCQSIEVRDALAMVLNQHRGHGVELRAEVEQGERSEWLPPLRRVHLVAIDVGVHRNGGTQLQLGIMKRERAVP